MNAGKKILAFDLGAESGRAMLGRFDGRRLVVEEIHRFANGPLRSGQAWHWDVLGLYQEMRAGLRRCVSAGGGIDSLGVDAWGVDFALLGRDRTLLGNPRHYRDPHTEGVIEAACARVPRAEIFQTTGIQFHRINTLIQLLALQRDRSPLLDLAEHLLFIPDLFHFFLTGRLASEWTVASTSQMMDARTGQWAVDLLRTFGLPTAVLGELVQPGVELGRLDPAVARDAGLAAPVPVIAPAAHDTASAVAAVPAQADTSWAYISSGTWSLIGVELQSPLISEQALLHNFTNERGFAGSVRFLKNIMGLWLVQQCRHAWEQAGQKFSYDELMGLAAAAPAFVILVNPDDDSFLLPVSMPAALGEYCRRTEQPVPVEPGPVVRCALESLALRYRWVIDRLEELQGRPIDVIHVVGGGSQNDLLCQFTADACNRPVLAGPVEATAIGNILVQAIGLGLLGSLAEAREVVRHSFPVRSFSPREPDRWQEPYKRAAALYAKD